MRRHIRLAASLAVALAAVPACRRLEPGTLDPVRALSRGESGYRPPADGLLTDAQIDRYVRSRRADREPNPAARAASPERDELDWTRTRIVEALAALDARRVTDPAIESYSRALASAREARRAARAPGDVSRLDAEIAALERERGLLRRAVRPSASVLRNAARIAPRRAELDAVGP